jgi:hypothetical protein
MRLQGRIVPVAGVTPAERDAMFALMDRHYDNVSRAAFDADLDEKLWVIQVVEPDDGKLCGFSTQRLLQQDVEGRSVLALFSGDTIIARAHWGDNALAHFWGRLALSLIDGRAEAELYWFLISKGYKTYRYLPLFFHNYHPRPDTESPPRLRAVLHALAASRYPDRFDPEAGVVHANGKDQLRPGVADVTEGRLQDKHVRFFVERNPGHAAGDELCCLAPLTRGNFTRAAWRVINLDPPAVPATGEMSHLVTCAAGG